MRFASTMPIPVNGAFEDFTGLSLLFTVRFRYACDRTSEVNGSEARLFNPFRFLVEATIIDTALLPSSGSSNTFSTNK